MKKLLGFENGVYDLTEGILEVVFRLTMWDLSTGIRFPIAPSDRPLKLSSLMDHVGILMIMMN